MAFSLREFFSENGVVPSEASEMCAKTLRSLENLASPEVLGEGKWERTKYRRIPKSAGDWKGRVPKCSPPPKLFKTRDLELPFFE